MTWDVLAAEVSDTAKAAPWNREQRPCYYCGEPTRALSGSCLQHADLAENDPLLNEPREEDVTP